MKVGSGCHLAATQRFLGALLLGYRLVEMLPDRDLVWLFKLLPVIFVVAAFSYLRENPFKINDELRFEGE